jgi:nitrite reductase (NADH) small subunit
MAPGKIVYNLGPLTRLPVGEGRTFRIGTGYLAVFRTREDKVFATQATCPHKNGPLADGIIGTDQVICPLHAYKFRLTDGAPLGNLCEALKTYPVTLGANGDILLAIDDDLVRPCNGETCPA